MKRPRWPIFILEATPPPKAEAKSPRVVDFEELDKKSIDTSIDFLKYISTSSGIMIGFYSNLIKDYLSDINKSTDSIANVILITPIGLWLSVILLSVYALFPRKYVADNDLKKERAVIGIRNRLSRCFSICGVLFSIAFILLFALMICYVWRIYPMNAKSYFEFPKPTPA